MPKQKARNALTSVSNQSLYVLPSISSCFEEEYIPVFIKTVLFKKVLDKQPEEAIRQLFNDEKYQFHTLDDLAFHWLCAQSPSWLNEHTATVELLWEACWTKSSPDEAICYDRIKALVDKTKAGLSVNFLDNFCTNTDFVGQAQAEVDSYLMWIKLEETEMLAQTSLLKWQQKRDRLKQAMQRKPYLIVVLLYLHRRVHQGEFLGELYNFYHNWEVYYRSYYDDFQELRPYFIVYLKQWLYLFFYTEEDDLPQKVRKFIDVYHNSVPWINSILGEILDDELFTEINEQIKHQKDQIISRWLTLNPKSIEFPQNYVIN